MRALSYNVHKCVGPLDRRYDPERVARVILHYAPDCVLLQEVAQASPRFRGERQIERLSELCGLRHWAYEVNVKKLGRGGEYGNAILSRFPLTGVENVSLKIPLKKNRSVLHARARVRLPDGRTRSLHLFNMHLGLSGLERRLQLEKFLACHPFDRLHARTPILVAGDLNDVWGTLGKLLEPAGLEGSGQRPSTYPSWAPVRRLDAAFARGDLRLKRLWRGRTAECKTASDHLPLVLDLELVGQRRRRPPGEVGQRLRT